MTPPDQLGHGSEPAVVAFGGGHGLAASLAALRRLTRRVTAVVTVADDGGSSGRLRDELDAVPPGDLRMALAALAGDDPDRAVWAALLQQRFGGDGPLAGHPVGNLMMVALAETHGLVGALDLLGELVGATGRVLPLALEPVSIAASVSGLRPSPVEVVGQHRVATTAGRVESVRLVPPSPRVCAEVVAAVDAADVLVLGPGSLFTSLLPHLLVPAVRRAVQGARARRVLVLNLAPQAGETSGFAPHHHLSVLAREVPGLHLDVVVADVDSVSDVGALERAARTLGAALHLAPVAVAGEARHDVPRLAAALDAVLPAGVP